MQLIGISGAARSGKDTIGEYLDTKYKFERYSFAGPLKRACSEMFGIPLDDFYNDDKKEVINEFWNFSPRQMAQLLGTEGGRELFREDIWVKRAELVWNRIENDAQKDQAGMVITDVRFPNEAKWVKDNGGVMLHINREIADGKVGVNAHASEAGYPDELKDYIIKNNGTIAELLQEANHKLGLTVLA